MKVKSYLDFIKFPFNIGVFMSFIKKKDGSYEGKCMSCKKKSLLQDFNGIKLCLKCEQKFYDQLIEKYEKEEFGRDIQRDKGYKKHD